MSLIQHPQFIYAVDAHFCLRNFCEGFSVVQPNSSYFKNIASYTVIAQRERLDSQPNLGYVGDRNFKQFLPYTLVALGSELTADTKLLTYRRSKGSGESRLMGNVSVGFGGHVDLEDTVTSKENPSVVDVIATLEHSSARELGEELAILDDHGGLNAFDLSPKVIGFINDNSNDVGKLHLATVQLILADSNRVVGNEEQIAFIEPMTARELLDSDLPLENWTRIVCDYIVRVGVENEPASDENYALPR